MNTEAEKKRVNIFQTLWIPQVQAWWLSLCGRFEMPSSSLFIYILRVLIEIYICVTPSLTRFRVSSQWSDVLSLLEQWETSFEAGPLLLASNEVNTTVRNRWLEVLKTARFLCYLIPAELSEVTFSNSPYGLCHALQNNNKFSLQRTSIPMYFTAFPESVIKPPSLVRPRLLPLKATEVDKDCSAVVRQN